MTRCLLLIGVMALATAEVRAAKPKPAAAEIHKRKAKQLFNEGRYDEAIAEYQAAHALAPDPKYWFNIALAYQRQGNKPQAIVYYRRYLADDPKGAASAEAREYVATLTREIAAEEAAAAPAAPPPAATPPPAAPAANPPSPTPAPPVREPAAEPPPPAPTTTAAAVEPGPPILGGYGLKLGVHASTVDDPDVPTDYRVGVVVGGFVTLTPTDWLGIELELLYAQKGCFPRGDFDGDPLTLHYLELPVLLRPTYRGLFFELGPYVSFLVHGDTAFTDQQQTVDLGLVFGAGYGLPVGDGKLIFEVRYELGLTSIKSEDVPKNRTISFALGYSFR